MNIQKMVKRWKSILGRKCIPLYRNIRRNLSKIGGGKSSSEIERFGSKNTWHRIKSKLEKPSVLYPVFIIGASMFCIVLAQFSHGSTLRIWYYNLLHQEVIGKGIEQRVDKEVNGGEMGTFLTHYRFRKFGASDPTEIDPSAPMVALTFDDGPNPENTTRILEVLNANYSHATFFVVGTNAEKYPEVLKEIASSGNEIGNHSYGHANFTKISEAEVEEQIDKVNRAVKKATGEIATVIRPPYGAYNDEVLNQLQQPVVLWDLDTEDWDSRNAQTIVENILNNVEDGDIILMHDIYESTAEAVEFMIPRLKEQGYQIMSVSEMAHYKGKELELHKAYGGIKPATE